MGALGESSKLPAYRNFYFFVFETVATGPPATPTPQSCFSPPSLLLITPARVECASHSCPQNPQTQSCSINKSASRFFASPDAIPTLRSTRHRSSSSPARTASFARNTITPRINGHGAR